MYSPTATGLTTEGFERLSASDRSQLQNFEAYPHSFESPLGSPSVQRHGGERGAGQMCGFGASIAVSHRLFVKEELGERWDRNF
jgi:hypothetical protein